MSTCFVSDMANVRLEMAVSGHGIARLPGHTARQAVAAGELSELGGDRWAIPSTIFADTNRADVMTAARQLSTFLARAADAT